MKKWLLLLLVANCYLPMALGQAVDLDAPQDYIANTITFPLQNPPQKVDINKVSVQLLDNPGPATYCYWIVSNFTIGNSSPAGPVCVSNGPNALVNGNQVSWQSVAGANSYDVLRTSTPAQPAGTCNCAIATAVSSPLATDTGLNAYTVNTLLTAPFNLVWDNEQAAAGQSQLVLRANGVVIFTINSTNGFVLPATLVRTNQSNTYSSGTTQDFSAVTLFKLRVTAGATTTTNGDAAYDSTGKNWHFFSNGVDNINVIVPAAVGIANNDCTNWVNSGGVITVADAGAPCATTTAPQSLTNKTLVGPTFTGFVTGSVSNSLITVTSTNTNLSTTPILPSVPATGDVLILLYAYDSAAGVGCTGNTTVVWTIGYGDVTGTGQAVTATETITTNGGSTGGDALKTQFTVLALSGTSITVSAIYTLGTGCSVGPKYSASIKAIL